MDNQDNEAHRRGQSGADARGNLVSSSRKVVLVTQGTVANHDFGLLVGPTLAALAGEPDILTVVTAGGRARDAVPGLKNADYVSDGELSSAVERAQAVAREAVARVRAGDVRHDPRGGTCPSWCERWTMCRIRRA